MVLAIGNELLEQLPDDWFPRKTNEGKNSFFFFFIRKRWGRNVWEICNALYFVPQNASTTYMNYDEMLGIVIVIVMWDPLLIIGEKLRV